MEKKKVSIVTLADLGDYKNLKTPAISPVIKKAAEEGVLEQVICRRNKNFFFEKTDSVSTPFFYLYKTIIKLIGIWKPQNKGKLEKQLLDYVFSKKDLKGDIVIAHPPSFYRTFKKLKLKKKTIVGLATIHNGRGLNGLIFDEYKKLGIESPKIITRNNQKNLNYFDYIIAYSDFVKKTYIKAGFSEQKIFVAYSDINLDSVKFKPQKKEGFKVLYVGHTGLRKGLHYLLKAWNDAGIQDGELVIVGDLKMSDDVKRKHEKMIKETPNVNWVGFQKDVSSYFNEASAFVLPSLGEGNPKVVMEAMAYGLPSIVTENGKSIIEDGKSGFVVPVCDPDSIKEKLLYLYKNRERAETMGKEARKAIEEKQPFAEEVFEIYREILKREDDDQNR